MTEHERATVAALGHISLPLAPGLRRFVNDMVFRAAYQRDMPLTDRQSHYLQRLAWRFRRQMPPHLVPAAEPPPLPPRPRPARATPISAPGLPLFGENP